jgi:hypothetical protein
MLTATCAKTRHRAETCNRKTVETALDTINSLHHKPTPLYRYQQQSASLAPSHATCYLYLGSQLEWRHFQKHATVKGREKQMPCDKIRYDNERQALDALREIRRKARGKSVRWLNHYPCTVCGGWHLGHDTLSKKIKETAAQDRKANRQRKTRQKVAAKSNRKALAELGYFHSVAESARIAKSAIDDLNDSLIIARQLAAEIFAGRRPA